MLLFISILILASISLLIVQLVPLLARLNERIKSARHQHQERVIRRPRTRTRSYKVNKQQIILMFIASLVATVIVAAVLFNRNLIAIIVAGVVGLLVPTLWIRGFYARFVRRFENQLPDALMIITSCLKGGLSLIQAMEVLVEEMPWPTNQEFSQILKENKMGISMEESLGRLNKRIDSEDLILFSSAITVSRETGGDLTEVFARLNESIRSRSKLLENVKTLTLQGKIQSIVLTILPLAFSFAIYKVNPDHFQLMLNTETGRIMLIIAGSLLAVGLFLIRIFSRVEV